MNWSQQKSAFVVVVVDVDVDFVTFRVANNVVKLQLQVKKS
jgi:hypothetical protein